MGCLDEKAMQRVDGAIAISLGLRSERDTTMEG